MHDDRAAREKLVWLLTGGNAHANFEKAVADFPAEYYNNKLQNIDFSPWQLLEHLRIAQWDILDFIINENYKSRKWPEDYWPSSNQSADEARWQKTLRDFRNDLNSLIELVEDHTAGLFVPLPHAPEYNIFREILLVADHNAYHLGQLIMMRKMLNIWP